MLVRLQTSIPWLALAAAAGMALLPARCGGGPAPPAAVAFATFNIEFFPKNQAQVDGAFDLIAELDIDFLAVQEITDPRAFAKAAARRLGPAWRFVHSARAEPAGDHPVLHTGVLYHRDRFSLASTRLHRDTTIEGRGLPTLEVTLEPRAGGEPLVAFVVHLKAGSDGRPLRARQLAALEKLVVRAVSAGGRVAVLGDFNATEEADRADIAALARRADLAWASEPLPCTAYWRRRDDCPGSRLDHVLTWAPPAEVSARGACETEGCDGHQSCPLYRERISDHCPVVVTVP